MTVVCRVVDGWVVVGGTVAVGRGAHGADGDAVAAELRRELAVAPGAGPALAVAQVTLGVEDAADDERADVGASPLDLTAALQERHRAAPRCERERGKQPSGARSDDDRAAPRAGGGRGRGEFRGDGRQQRRGEVALELCQRGLCQPACIAGMDRTECD